MGHTGKRLVVWADEPRALWEAEHLPFGLLRRTINADPANGAETLVVDIPTGWTMEESLWNEADLEFVVLEGDLEIAGVSATRGAHGFLPAGTPLGPIRSQGGAEIIWWHDSTFQLRTGTPPSPTKPRSFLEDLYDEANWDTIVHAFEGVTDVGSHDGLEVPTRCIRLRKVEESGKDTILFVLPRGFQKTSLEYHHSTEEIFILGGWTATDPYHVYMPGQYLCWEPGVIHGVVSGWDGLCLSKHHGPLTSPNIPVGAVSVDITA